jgi:streptogramin lyase
MLALTGALAIVAAIVAAIALVITRDDTPSLESLPAGVAVLSATDGSLVAHISTNTIPFPSEVLTGDASFWVWSLQPFSMVEIHPQTGEIGRRVGSPFSGDADGFTVDGRDIWFTGPRDLVRVDSATGQAVDRFRLASANHHLGLGTPVKCAGQMWVANNDGNVLMRVNPETGAVDARIPMPSPWGLACGGGAVWVTSNFAGDVRRVDTRTNEVTGTAQTPPSSSIAYGAGFAWTSSEIDGTVYKIGRRGRVVTSYETGDGARQLSFGAGKLWVANQDAGTVTGIDAATGATTTYGFGHPVQSVAVSARISSSSSSTG